MPDHTYSVSREELERLRRQVGDLKGQPVAVQHTATLIESMDRLHEALSRLIVIFESANRDMAEEAARGIHDEHGKLDRLLDQNEKIARAVVQLADIVKSQRSEMPRTITAAAPAAQSQQVPPPLNQPPAPRDETRQSFLATPAAPAPMPSFSAPAAPPVLPSMNPAPMQTGAPVPPPLPAVPTANLNPPSQFPSQQFNALPTGLGGDMIRPTLSPPAPAQFNPTPQSMPQYPSLPASPRPSVLPAAPLPPPDVRSTNAPGNAAPIRPSSLPPMPLPSQMPFPSQPFAGMPPPNNPPRQAMRQTPLAEQNSFMTQPVTAVQPAFATDGVLAPLPPPPPPESKRSLLNRFAFK